VLGPLTRSRLLAVPSAPPSTTLTCLDFLTPPGLLTIVVVVLTCSSLEHHGVAGLVCSAVMNSYQVYNVFKMARIIYIINRSCHLSI